MTMSPKAGIACLFVTALLAACASTGVVPLDQDSYFLGKKDASPGLGVSLSNKADVLKEAGAFCGAKGMQVKVLELTSTPSRPAQFGSTELQFRCVPLGGEARDAVPRAPDEVIEKRIR